MAGDRRGKWWSALLMCATLSAAPVPTTGATARSTAVAPPLPDIAARLRENGASQCNGQINAAGAAALAGATQYDSLSNWNPKGGPGRGVNVVLGQRYPATGAIPSGVTSIVATPVAAGRCDLVSVQVVPSPFGCERLQATMAAGARAVGQLAGVAVMQRGATQTLLVPTAAKTCVVVDLTTRYAT